MDERSHIEISLQRNLVRFSDIPPCFFLCFHLKTTYCPPIASYSFFLSTSSFLFLTLHFRSCPCQWIRPSPYTNKTVSMIFGSTWQVIFVPSFKCNNFLFRRSTPLTVTSSDLVTDKHHLISACSPLVTCFVHFSFVGKILSALWASYQTTFYESHFLLLPIPSPFYSDSSQ